MNLDDSRWERFDELKEEFEELPLQDHVRRLAELETSEDPQVIEYLRRHLQDPAVIARLKKRELSGETTLLKSADAELSSEFPTIPGLEILGELGKGGMGQVFKARQTSLDRVVALKIIHPEKAGQSEIVNRFIHEAKAMATLMHPNIVHIHDLGQHDGQPYFFMEFCEGGSLKEKLEARRTLSEWEAATLLKTLAAAVAHAHEKGIIHRDLKPANVLLMKNGTPKVSDFGLAKALQESGLTSSGVGMGTPAYMAPEQKAPGRPIGPHTDIYALGVILYECLTGNRDVILNNRGQPRFLAVVCPKNDQLKALCLQCLKPDPAKRPNAKALIELLDSSLLQLSPVAEKLSTNSIGIEMPPIAAEVETELHKISVEAVDNIAITHQPADSRPTLRPNTPDPDSIFTNSLKMEFTFVRRGTFWMSANGKNAQREVTIDSDFYIGVYPVTQGQWQNIMSSDSLHPNWFSHHEKAKGRYLVKDIPAEELTHFPKESVTWKVVQDFIDELNKRTQEIGWTYRLPWENEWEYACRAGANSKENCSFDYYFGEPTNVLTELQANFNNYLGRTCRVGSYQANFLGIHDMHGNVREMCLDPVPRSNTKKTTSPLLYVTRGGSWRTADCRAADRSQSAENTKYEYVGFRLVRVQSGG